MKAMTAVPKKTSYKRIASQSKSPTSSRSQASSAQILSLQKTLGNQQVGKVVANSGRQSIGNKIGASAVQNKKTPLEKAAEDISEILGLPYADYDLRFASKKEIKSITKRPAWGTVTKENGRWTVLVDKSLSRKMDGTRFRQTLAEELVHIEQLSTGYDKRLGSNKDFVSSTLESEATGWVMSHAKSLGLRLRGKDYKDFKLTNKDWEKMLKKSVP